MSYPELEYLACPSANCGGQWLPAAKLQQLRESHETFFCPSGHSQWFVGKTEKEKRIEALEAQVRNLTRERDYYKRWWEELKAQSRIERRKQYALKGVITKLKKAS